MYSRFVPLRSLVLTIGIAAASVPESLLAQRASLHGVIRDSSGAPVPEVDVSIPAQRLLVRTNQKGEFGFGQVQPGSVKVSMRRLGFHPRTITLDVTEGRQTLDVVLAEQARLLETMEVSDREQRRRMSIEAFYRRRARGPGLFITREDIEARKGASRLSDILRDHPGIRFERGRAGAVNIRFINSQSQRRDCVPQIWIDGVRVPGMELDDFPINDIEGIEIYDGAATTPMQFSPAGPITSCGTIVLWSRVPGT